MVLVAFSGFFSCNSLIFNAFSGFFILYLFVHYILTPILFSHFSFISLSVIPSCCKIVSISQICLFNASCFIKKSSLPKKQKYGNYPYFRWLLQVKNYAKNRFKTDFLILYFAQEKLFFSFFISFSFIKVLDLKLFNRFITFIFDAKVL